MAHACTFLDHKSIHIQPLPAVQAHVSETAGVVGKTSGVMGNNSLDLGLIHS